MINLIMKSIWQPHIFLSQQTSNTKPVIIISGCLAGDSVRYDGKHKYQQNIIKTLNPYITFSKCCPEVSAQLGIPRPPIHITVDTQHSDNAQQGAAAYNMQVRDIANPDCIVTDRLHHASQILLATAKDTEVIGCLLKSRSPSCGLGTTPYYSLSTTTVNKVHHTGNGIFAENFIAAFPRYPAADEALLSKREGLALFLWACYVAADEKRFVGERKDEHNFLQEKFDEHMTALLNTFNLPAHITYTSPKQLFTQLLNLTPEAIAQVISIIYQQTLINLTF